MPNALLFVLPETTGAFSKRHQLEAEAADAIGLPWVRLSLEEVVDGQLGELPRGRWVFVYRGWMLKEDEYAALDDALREVGHRLFTTPHAYAAAHFLPQWYPRVEGYTARSVWTDDASAAHAWELAQTLGPPPWIIKDHVKSGSVVPTGASRSRFVEAVDALVAERGDRFERGIVVRRYLPFVRYQDHFCEFRLFFIRGALVAAAPSFDDDLETPDFSAFEALANRIASPFITIDVAALETGGWAVVEIGDGGVSLLPEQVDPRDVFSHWRS